MKNQFFVLVVPSEKEINYYLSVLHHRSIDAGASFKFFGKELQLVDSGGRVVRII